jgi:signal transduction histidine kinase
MPNGERLHWRMRTFRFNGQSYVVAASAPSHAITTPLRQSFLPLAIALVVLGVLLYSATLIQVRVGLRPLRLLREGVAAIRSGTSTSLPENQPAEIQPLVDEMNNLLQDNQAGLERARRHASNLAHGLKTPLAALAMSLENPTASNLGSLRTEVDRMDRLIRHHLSRSRAAVVRSTARASTQVNARLSDMVSLMRNIHRERLIVVDFDCEDGLVASVEVQDFDEIVGNLLDNASKWARSRVSVTALRAGGIAIIEIADDGPGIAPDQMPEVLRPGRRLDESAPGYGFGLAIARELVELYGGNLALRPTPQRGLLARVELPATAAPLTT